MCSQPTTPSLVARFSLSVAATFIAIIPFAAAKDPTYAVPVTITSELPFANVPIDPVIDFTAIIQGAHLPGVLDPNSIEVVNLATKQIEPHALNQDFRNGNKGHVRWLARQPSHREFEVRFKTGATRSFLPPPKYTPQIGVGDLLRYNAGEPRPVGPYWVSRLVDLTGDGVQDMIGFEMYSSEPSWPENRVPDGWGNVYCYPGVKGGGGYNYSNAVRLRYQEKEGGPFHLFEAGYMAADMGDLNGDGLPDIAYAVCFKSNQPNKIPEVYKFIHLFLNTGKRDESGMPIFMMSAHIPIPEWEFGGGTSVQIVDLDQDGVVDLVVGKLFSQTDTHAHFIRNTNPKGWPFQAAEPVKFESGKRAVYYDVDQDGKLDSVCLITDEKSPRKFCVDLVAWRKGAGGAVPQFAPPQILEGITMHTPSIAAAHEEKGKRGLVVTGGRGDRVAFYEQTSFSGGKPKFREHVIQSVSAPIRMGDQATPFICDWNNDGVWDLLTGGGLGYVQVLINHGTNEKPAFGESEPVMSEGKQVLIHQGNVFPGLRDYNDDLGYVHPCYVDWDADGLPDLIVPNLSNRIVWYKNIGTRKNPKFGPRQYVECDGYPENEETRKATARLMGSETKEWKIRFTDPNSPFHWRSRAAFADFNGDGLMDLITADGQSPLTPNRFSKYSCLFVQYRDAQGKLRLRKESQILMPDGTPMQNVPGTAAQFIATDWDGDGLIDLIINEGLTLSTAPAVVRNIGTKQKPKFDFPQKLACFGEVMTGMVKHGPYYGIGDMDGDGKPDLLASTENGTYLFFRRTALDMSDPPTIKLGDVRVLSRP